MKEYRSVSIRVSFLDRKTVIGVLRQRGSLAAESTPVEYRPTESSRRRIEKLVNNQKGNRVSLSESGIYVFSYIDRTKGK